MKDERYPDRVLIVGKEILQTEAEKNRRPFQNGAT